MSATSNQNDNTRFSNGCKHNVNAYLTEDSWFYIVCLIPKKSTPFHNFTIKQIVSIKINKHAYTHV